MRIIRVFKSSSEIGRIRAARSRRRSITVRHDRAMQLLVKYARSVGVLASLSPKDLSSLVPDGEFFLSRETVLVDLSGTHPLSPSLISSQNTSQSAIERRAASKTSKYRQHCAALGARFIPFILDSYGSIGVEALRFIDVIESEAPLLGIQDPLRISKASFLSSLSHQWQSDNAAIVKQWLREIRSKLYISV